MKEDEAREAQVSEAQIAVHWREEEVRQRQVTALAAFSITPLGVGESVGGHLAEGSRPARPGVRPGGTMAKTRSRRALGASPAAQRPESPRPAR